MGLIDEVFKYPTLSIIGLEKNTGKTECLNYILGKVKDSRRCFAVTSIGVDGERRDSLYGNSKPEIELYEGMLFVTSEKYYREKRLTAELLDVSQIHTSLGRLVTAQVIHRGKVMLSGPTDTYSLKTFVNNLIYFGANQVIIDGALSRMSTATPGVTDATILTTGAAVSKDIRQLVNRTRFVCDLIGLPAVEDDLRDSLMEKTEGMWAIDSDGELHDLHISSVFLFNKSEKDLFRYGHRIFVAGAVSEKLLNFLRIQKVPTELIVRDFTRIFVTPEAFHAFEMRGGVMKVVLKTSLLSVCINPQSPDGYCLDSDILREAMQQQLDVPVYDIRKI